MRHSNSSRRHIHDGDVHLPPIKTDIRQILFEQRTAARRRGLILSMSRRGPAQQGHGTGKSISAISHRIIVTPATPGVRT